MACKESKSKPHGTRMTVQRMRILEYLKSVKTHPTAEEVYIHVRKEIPSMTLATVYRNLHCLSGQGKASMIEAGGKSHFDADMCCHQHCICRKCGAIIDWCSCRISKCAMNSINAIKNKNPGIKGFAPECAVVILRGLCGKCAGASNAKCKKEQCKTTKNKSTGRRHL